MKVYVRGHGVFLEPATGGMTCMDFDTALLLLEKLAEARQEILATAIAVQKARDQELREQVDAVRAEIDRLERLKAE